MNRKYTDKQIIDFLNLDNNIEHRNIKSVEYYSDSMNVYFEFMLAVKKFSYLMTNNKVVRYSDIDNYIIGKRNYTISNLL